MTPLRLPLATLLLLTLLPQLQAGPTNYTSTAPLSTTWTNNSTSSGEGYPFFSILLLHETPPFTTPTFACGFYCGVSSPCTTYLFSVFIVSSFSKGYVDFSVTPAILWTPNRNRPVSLNSTLRLTKDGNLILNDSDGSLVWSSNTTGKSVVGMNLTARGNLVLFDDKSTIVWQSFDHPTDTLVSGQSLVKGQRLTADVSPSNWSEGPLYITWTPDQFSGFIAANPPQKYYIINFDGSNSIMKIVSTSKYQCALSLSDSGDALTFLANYSFFSSADDPAVSTVQFLKFQSGGYFKLYEWDGLRTDWYPTADVTQPVFGDCGYPTVCGSYGVCSSDRTQCSCPQPANGSISYFKPVNYTQPNEGCVAVSPLSCTSQQNQRLLELQNVYYFGYVDDVLVDPKYTTVESCKEGCLKNCSCKAALIRYDMDNASLMYCYLPQEVFSFNKISPQDGMFKSVAYIKVMLPPATPPPSLSNATKSASESHGKSIVLPVVLGVLSGVLVFVIVGIVLYRRSRTKEFEEEEDDFAQLPGMATRFSYEDLIIATKDFAEKLGEGGFGSVFEGTLQDGTRIAVKKLESVHQGKREFMAEVETIGSIHHLNLARLVGFCAEKLHRLLVYEYMDNGSLDNWIFGKTKDQWLSWSIRCKVIHDVAKGLLYLHEECRHKIMHLDIKPQNILLDSSFNAKVSDFGLAKLMDREQSGVLTMMRGTPGYLAPEWLTSAITEKVDVYSFGVVILEIVCGRKNLDYSKPPESVHLISLLKQKAVSGQLVDVVDERIGDKGIEVKEVEKMLRLSIWCLQNDPNDRPSMSMVVKVLEGTMDVIPNLNYDFATPGHGSVKSSGSTPMFASILSGPR